MIAKEFLNAFQKTTHDFVWKYAHENHIRGFLKSDETGRAFDPIEATLLVSGRGNSGLDSTLGLSALDRKAITNAANGEIWQLVDEQLVLDGYAAWLRDALALAVGLEPDEVSQYAPPQTQMIPTRETALDSGARAQPV